MYNTYSWFARWLNRPCARQHITCKFNHTLTHRARSTTIRRRDCASIARDHQIRRRETFAAGKSEERADSHRARRQRALWKLRGPEQNGFRGARRNRLRSGKRENTKSSWSLMKAEASRGRASSREGWSACESEIKEYRGSMCHSGYAIKLSIRKAAIKSDKGHAQTVGREKGGMKRARLLSREFGCSRRLFRAIPCGSQRAKTKKDSKLHNDKEIRQINLEADIKEITHNISSFITHI